MMRRFLGFTVREWIILCMGIAAGALLFITFPGTWWRILVVGYAWGFVFEASMEPLFTYHAQLRERHCIGKTDLNVLFPLGWLEILACTAWIGERLVVGSRLFSYIAGGLIAGNAHEFLFYRGKFWVYHYEAEQFRGFRPFQPKITIAGVPLVVVVGYGVVGCMVYGIIHGIL